MGPSSQLDTLVQGQELKDGDNLVSAHGKFKLGLFHLTSNNYYLGKWYNGKHAELENLVWVANRDTPIFDNSGNLTIDDYGNLKISHNGGPPIVLYSAQEASNTGAALLETGNLVLTLLSELNSGRQLWQSFDYPTHTLLPGMKLGVSRKTGHTWSLRSWISSRVPAASSLTFGMDPKPTNQLVILRHDIICWNCSGLTDHYNFSYVSNENEAYFYYHGYRRGYEDVTTSRKLTLDDWGELYDDDNVTLTNCGRPNLVKIPECRNGFYEFYPDYGSWDAIDGFKFNEDSLLDCKFKCWNNCSCVAFASTNEDTQTGCLIWSTPVIFGPHSNVTRTIYFFRGSGKSIYSMLDLSH